MKFLGLSKSIKPMLLLVCFVLFTTTAFASGEYIKTDKDIKVWNLDPEPDMTANWTGSSDASGFASGKGILTLYKNNGYSDYWVGMFQNYPVNYWGKRRNTASIL